MLKEQSILMNLDFSSGLTPFRTTIGGGGGGLSPILKELALPKRHKVTPPFMGYLFHVGAYKPFSLSFINPISPYPPQLHSRLFLPTLPGRGAAYIWAAVFIADASR